jgi:DNA-binding MarR family transcriptional regulator
MSPSPAPAAPVAVREDEELAAALRVAVMRLYRGLRQRSLGGLSPAQMSALATVDRRGNPTLGELAAEEQVQPPTMTRLVAGLEAQGLVARAEDAGDRRVSRVGVTPEGRRTLQRTRSLRNSYLATRLAALSEEERRALDAALPVLELLGTAP